MGQVGRKSLHRVPNSSDHFVVVVLRQSGTVDQAELEFAAISLTQSSKYGIRSSSHHSQLNGL